MHHENKLEWSEIYENQPALHKLFVALNTGEGLSEVCDTAQLTVIPTETSSNPAHLRKGPCPGLSLLLQPHTFARTWQVPYKCKVKPRTGISSEALTSFSTTRISHYDFLLYEKRPRGDGAQLLTAQTSDTNNTSFTLSKTIFKLRFWQVLRCVI